LAACSAVAAGQAERKLTARELFYTPVAEAKAPSETKPAKPSKPAQKQQATVKQETASKPPRVETRTSAARIQTVAAAPPLGLRYSILKLTGETYEEVDAETVFRSGDKIRVTVRANDSGYLYIVHQGSSKTWALLFPNEQTEHGSNKVEANRDYVLPAGGRFVFDENPGKERVFVVLTRQPEPDIEKLIYSLSSGSPQAAPAEHRTLLAQAKLEDSMVARLRSTVLARDLVFEKVEASTGPKPEKAVYVATEDRSPQARVVVDLNLNHR
jgi:hypothetical protein